MPMIDKHYVEAMVTDDRQRPRLVGVVRVADVPVSTASRALGRGSELIGAQTRSHVRQVAHELGYRVSLVTRSLRLTRAKQIGMVVLSISNPFFMELAVQVEHCLAKRGLSLLLSDSQMSVIKEDFQLRSPEGGSVDGLISMPCHEAFSTPALERASSLVNTTQLDRVAQLPELPMVGIGDRHGIRAILEHLRDKGAQYIALLSNTGTDVSSMTRVSEARIIAEELGMQLKDTDVVECNFSVESARNAVSVLLARGDKWDAFVCLNDLTVIGATTGLRHRGWRISEEVMVTGSDDIQFAQLMQPSLTTLRQPLAEIARRGVDLLLSEDESIEKRIIMRDELIVRESTGFEG